MTSLVFQFMDPGIHSHFDVDAPRIGPAQCKPHLLCAMFCGHWGHTKFIYPTPAIRMSTVFMHFLFYSVIYCYLSPPYFLSYFYYPAGFWMPQKHIWYSPESFHTTWHKLSVVWRLKVSVQTRPQVCWGRILCSQHGLWVSPSPHRAAQRCTLWSFGTYEEMWYRKYFKVRDIGRMPSPIRLAFFLLYEFSDPW